MIINVLEPAETKGKNDNKYFWDSKATSEFFESSRKKSMYRGYTYEVFDPRYIEFDKGFTEIDLIDIEKSIEVNYRNVQQAIKPEFKQFAKDIFIKLYPFVLNDKELKKIVNLK